MYLFTVERSAGRCALLFWILVLPPNSEKFCFLKSPTFRTNVLSESAVPSTSGVARVTAGIVRSL